MTNTIALLTTTTLESGAITSLVSIVVVFVSLTVLILIFMGIPKVLELKVKSKLKKEGVVVPESEINIEAEVNAAIALGIHMYLNELHDEESNIITIKTAQKQYSPWNSKIYGVQNQPVRK